MASVLSDAIGIGNVAPGLGGAVRKGSDRREIFASLLDFVFRDCALLFMSPSKAYGLPSGFDTVSLPVLGFSFKTPDTAVLAKYSYSEYPYLSKAAVANSFLKECGEFEVTGLRPITRGNNIITNYALNNVGIKKWLEGYADRGGLFALNTFWGYYNNLALEELSGVKVDGSELGGIGFKFKFKRINFADIDEGSIISQSVFSGL